MFAFGFRRWLRQVIRRHSGPCVPLRRTFHPQVEQLEAREVPAVYRVTFLMDSAPGGPFIATGDGSAATPFQGPSLTLRAALENANYNADTSDTIRLTRG